MLNNNVKMAHLATIRPSHLDVLIANELIRYAMNNKMPCVSGIRCNDCGQLPVMPVTGQCGHTRCYRCVERTATCTCGVPRPRTLYINIVVQDIIETMVEDNYRGRLFSGAGPSNAGQDSFDYLEEPSCSGPMRIRRVSYPRSLTTSGVRSSQFLVPLRIPLSSKRHIEVSWHLLMTGRHFEAALHMVRAVTCNIEDRNSRILLNKFVSVLSRDFGSSFVYREIHRLLKFQSTSSWLPISSVECTICGGIYESPVTTPCGHTFCLKCITTAMTYRKKCPLCLRSLISFNLTRTGVTVFLTSILNSINAWETLAPLEANPNVIAIFACTLAYPQIPYPVLIINPNCALTVRRVMDLGTRKIGIVPFQNDGSQADIGTVLEIRDCVQLEDGKLIVSTVGVSRFHIIRRIIQNECEMAHIELLIDEVLPTEFSLNLQVMARTITDKALFWFNSLSPGLQEDVLATFGRPHYVRPNYSYQPNGPAWLWWFIAILPLRQEMKVLLLSTKNYIKRMMVVSRTLDLIIVGDRLPD